MEASGSANAPSEAGDTLSALSQLDDKLNECKALVSSLSGVQIASGKETIYLLDRIFPKLPLIVLDYIAQIRKPREVIKVDSPSNDAAIDT